MFRFCEHAVGSFWGRLDGNQNRAVNRMRALLEEPPVFDLIGGAGASFRRRGGGAPSGFSREADTAAERPSTRGVGNHQEEGY